MTILSVFSSSLPGTFLIPRTVDATAIIFKEPDTTFAAKESLYSPKNKKLCPKTIIPLGKVKRRLRPFFNKIEKITRPISNLKSKLYQKLGISCVLPRLLRRYQPNLQRISCKLGLDEEDDNPGFIHVNAFTCNSNTVCRESSFESKFITRSHGLPNVDLENDNQINTYDECFSNTKKITYGARVISKLVNDVSCQDPRYQGICQELEVQNRIVFEDDCQTAG